MPTPDTSDTKGTASEPVDLLVRAGFLYPVEGQREVIFDAEVAMRGALNAVRLRAGRHDALTTAEALELATAGAAEAMGMGGRIGRLTPGREADMILVDLDRPHLQPFYGDPASLVYYARASDVTDSIVRGRMVMREGEIRGIDAEAALAEVKARAPHWGALMRELGGVSHLPACPCGAH